MRAAATAAETVFRCSCRRGSAFPRRRRGATTAADGSGVAPRSLLVLPFRFPRRYPNRRGYSGETPGRQANSSAVDDKTSNGNNNNGSISGGTVPGTGGTTIQGTIPSNGVGGFAVDQYAQVENSFTSEEVASFGRLIRDANPLHGATTRTPEQATAAAAATSATGTIPAEIRNHPMFQVRRGKEGEGDGSPAPVSAVAPSPPGQPPRPRAAIVVHGIFVASMFSRILGTLLPGSVYLNQTLEFRKPVFVGDAVRARISVRKVRNLGRRGVVLCCDTDAFVAPRGAEGGDSKEAGEDCCVTGKAEVWVVDGAVAEPATAIEEERERT